MINCGGTMDIVEFLEPPEDLVSINSIGPVAVGKLILLWLVWGPI
jgi:hypothetical protein